MGKHSTPRGENGTYTNKTGKAADYTGKHRPTTPSDVPPRGQNVKDVNTDK